MNDLDSPTISSRIFSAVGFCFFTYLSVKIWYAILSEGGSDPWMIVLFPIYIWFFGIALLASYLAASCLWGVIRPS